MPRQRIKRAAALVHAYVRAARPAASTESAHARAIAARTNAAAPYLAHARTVAARSRNSSKM